MELDDLVTNLEDFLPNINNTIKECLEGIDYIICDLNTQDQLYNNGVNADNEVIMDYEPYSEITIKIKQNLGQPTDRVTLKNEGDFYRGFTIEFSDGGFYITSLDKKAEQLALKYSTNLAKDNIFGLTDNSVTKLCWDYLIDLLIIKFKEI
jgi:hypothetical protein